jgi:fido (protein-threonine AMPylation protein)
MRPPSAPPVCNFRAAAGAGEVLPRRCAQAAAALAAQDEAGRLAALCDTRALHRGLFEGLAPAAWPDAAGTWRGTPGTSVAAAPRAVFLARRMPGLRGRDPCLPAAAVAAAMDDLAQTLRRLWHDRPGADDPWRDAAFRALGDATARFFAIHPYMDGNGHVWRLALPVLAARLGLAMREGWRVDRRPYGPEFSLALQWHADHPLILADQLRRWMAPPR